MSPHDQWKTAPNLTDDFPPLISLAPPSDQLGYERGAGVPNQGDTGIWIDAQVLALACCAPRREEEAGRGRKHSRKATSIKLQILLRHLRAKFRDLAKSRGVIFVIIL